MPLLRNRSRALVALLLLAWLAIPALAAPLGEPRPKNDSPAERVRKALDQVTDVKIENQTLDAAINQLHDTHKINFVLDRTAVATMGIDPMNGNPVSLDLTNVKLRTALRSLLAPLHLTYAIIGDTVVITTEEAAVSRQLRQRVSIDLDRTALAPALKQLARETATNLLVDPRVGKEAETPITLQIDDVPLETAVRLMAEMAGLKPARLGNVLLVTSKANAAELRAEPELVPPLKPAAPEDVGVPVPVPGVPGVAVPKAVAPPAPPAEKEEKKKEEKEDKPAPSPMRETDK
jgi:hypothetical protein